MKNLFPQKQSGQAMLEYVLLLFVIVIIFFAFILGLAEGTRRFADNYFGAYFQCLLETGELPTLGSDSASTADTECDESFQEFSLAEGRPPVSTDITGGGAGDNVPTTGTTSDSDGSSGSEGSSTSAYVPAGSSGSFGVNGFGRQSKVPISKSGSRKAGEGAENPGGLVSNTTAGEEGSSSGSSSTYVPVLSGRSGTAEEVEGAPTLVAVNNPNDEEDLRETKRVPAAAQAKAENAEDVDAGLTLPDFLRYIIIIGVILAIVVFLGGQVLQYQKSKE